MRISDTPAAQHAADAVAGGAIIATLAGWLPPVAAVLSIIWFAYQILDLWDRRRMRKRAAMNQRRRATDAL